MNAYVVALRYKVLTSPDRDFHNAPPLNAETPEFIVHLAKDELVLRPRTRIATSEEARAAAADFIRAWEIDAGLRYSAANPFQLVYSGAEIGGTGPQGASLVGIQEVARMHDECSSHLSHVEYPPPPATARLSPEAEAIWGRLERYLAGQEPLLSMAYFCLTTLTQVGGLDVASKKYLIDKRYLSEISRLSSTRGDALTARKLTQQTQPLTTDEKDWLTKAIKKIVKHLLQGSPEEWLK